ncbi:MAG: L-2-amino-thiazoline-4-carboxylic acid hydrolase [Armatimonadota bacterium]|nr:L-2-amino-thiazoline-4-carboxylic acid hydrolase [Armatimonadota bacterium]MDR7510525.1 L-2-amino-thiazoline-4-carboxylic acid hydrolase [Armatimonadota bacterium]
MTGGTRPHRVQQAACRRAVAEVLGEAEAETVLREAGIAGLPDTLPAAPRDLEALHAELQPFVDLYRAVRARAGREVALAVARRAIVESGRVSHALAAERQRTADDPDGPLNVTSPPPPGFAASPEALARRFATAMRFFSCEGRLLAYTPEEVRFHITACNWVRALERAGAPELVPFFCETDERFMDGHPTHRLVRPTAIGLGDDHCDFRFVPNALSANASGG